MVDLEMYRPFGMAPSLARIDFQELRRQLGIRYAVLDLDGVIAPGWTNSCLWSLTDLRTFHTPSQEGITNVLRAVENRWLEKVGVLSNIGTYLLWLRLRRIASLLHAPSHGCAWPAPMKPDPQSAYPLFAKMGFDPTHTVSVGDQAKDILLANRSAMKGILVPPFGRHKKVHRRDQERIWTPLGIKLPALDTQLITY